MYKGSEVLFEQYKSEDEKPAVSSRNMTTDAPTPVPTQVPTQVSAPVSTFASASASSSAPAPAPAAPANVQQHVGNAKDTKASTLKSTSQLPQQPKTELLCHYPGTVTAVAITLFEGGKTSGDICNEVNFRLVLRSVGITKDANGLQRRPDFISDAAPTQEGGTGSSGQKDGAHPVPQNSKKRPQGGENWVELLEKKYSKPLVASPVGLRTSPANDGKTVKLGKRSADHGDFYESDDSFIDDSELIEDVNKEMSKRGTKTVHR